MQFILKSLKILVLRNVGSCILHYLCNLSLASNIYWLLVGTYMRGTDPCFDPFCVWGNEIFMNKRQVRKLRKIVRRKKRVIGIKLFIYTLSKTTVNFRMVSNVSPFPPAHNKLLYQTLVSDIFSFQWFSKLFTDDYLANYMTGVEATKVKVYNSCYHDNALEVFLKAMKDGRAIVTRGWAKVVRAYGMQEGTLWAFRFFNTIGSQNDLNLSLHLYRL